jgi:hypothetical protein
MMRMGLIVAVFALASCAQSPAQQEGKVDGVLHYQVLASIAAGGELTADVTITLPPGTFSEGDFILGRRFALQPIETSPHAEVKVEPTDEPLDGLHGIHVRFDGARTAQARPMTVRFRYSGPIFAGDKQDRLGYTPEAIEMALELMWLPYVSQLNRRFTVDAQLRGIAPDMVVVAQGEVRHEGDRVYIHRPVADFDFAWAAVRGLKVAREPGVEFYARDFDDPLAQILRKHALAAARFHQQWFGPLPGGPIRLAIVPRGIGGAYARIGYTIIADGRKPGEPPPEVVEVSRAATVAHEFAHAWWAPADPFSEDYWLAESIAQYASWRYIEATFGTEKLYAELQKARDAIKDAGPVLGHGRASRLVLYTKTPLLLKDLEDRIGREQFDSVLVKLSHNPPRKTQEFLDALRGLAGDKVAADFEAALRAG